MLHNYCDLQSTLLMSQQSVCFTRIVMVLEEFLRVKN